MPPSFADYLAVPGEEPESCRTSTDLDVQVDDSPTRCDHTSGTRAARSYSHVYPWAVAICMVCTVLNAVLFTATVRPPASPSSTPITRKDIWKLRKPSQYIHFDEVERATPPIPRQFDNFPVAIAQVDSLDVGRVLDSGLKLHMAASGSYVPDDKQVVIAEQISTVVEFLAIDYGMERCELRLEIDSGHIMGPSSAPFTLEIFRLNSTVPIDTETLRYETLPARMSKVASLDVPGEAVRWHRSFHCVMDEYLAFELGCRPALGEKACRVQWWQSAAHHPSAIFIRQHATV